MSLRRVSTIALSLTPFLSPFAYSQVCSTSRISLNSAGGQANSESSQPSISGSGRYIAFQSAASNLVANDTNNMPDIFVRDRTLNTVNLISVASDETQGNNISEDPAISPTGRFVAFSSYSTNLVAGDANGTSDIFLRDLYSGTTERVSVGLQGAEANGASTSPSISSDGRYIAFRSAASNLVDGDTNNIPDIFVYDRELGVTERINVTPNGSQVMPPYFSETPRISPDGRFVVFASTADSLVVNDTNSVFDIFLRDRLSGTTERVSLGNGGIQANGPCRNPDISPDARFVVFESSADNLASGDSNAATDVYLRDRSTGITAWISVTSGGLASDLGADTPKVSADGKFVAFVSSSSNLVSGDNNGARDVFVRNRETSRTEFASVASDETLGNGASLLPAMNQDGRLIAFLSSATNLDTGDTNGLRDIFVRNHSCHLFDCNQNGVDDPVDIANGTSTDCNGNYVPDECESSDCNGNGVWDICEILTGLTTDCNHNQVPDECELPRHDCNNNGVVDSCDVASGTSADINHNGVPDECEAPQQIFVDANASSDVGADGSEGNPFKSIKAGIEAALSGDVVRVRPGTYTGANNKEITLNGRRIVIQSTAGAASTILNLGNSGSAFRFGDGDNELVVLEGFTIRNARTAIWVSTGACPRIRNCVLTNNSTFFSGGAIFVGGANANPVFENCTISNNSAGNLGGGAYVTLGNPKFLRCTFSNNAGSYGGGGIYAKQTSTGPTVEACKFFGNSGLAGGGVMAEGTNALLLDSVFQDNISYSTGGGVHCSSLPQSSPSDEVADDSRIVNCTIVENTTTNLGGGVYFGGLTTGNLENTILWDNQSNNGDEMAVSGWSLTGTYPANIVMRYNDIRNGQPGIHLSNGGSLQWGPGNIAVPPIFGPDGYHLRAGSPCLDAGDPLRLPLTPTETDIDGAARIQGGRVEIGADELLVPTAAPRTRGGAHPF